eukprot:TRINITY_DN12202_c0_g1_i1.p1 TRINITY_DN12202_c0_g1~~TRINITY_DN12202_c0_g1_i1.p1  ORF type:complete len:494 (+),score=78.67 TRINITY_DN12202_c0_g1_i1:171-1652(+)
MEDQKFSSFQASAVFTVSERLHFPCYLYKQDEKFCYEFHASGIVPLYQEKLSEGLSTRKFSRLYFLCEDARTYAWLISNDENIVKIDRDLESQLYRETEPWSQLILTIVQMVTRWGDPYRHLSNLSDFDLAPRDDHVSGFGREDFLIYRKIREIFGRDGESYYYAFYRLGKKEGNLYGISKKATNELDKLHFTETSQLSKGMDAIMFRPYQNPMQLGTIGSILEKVEQMCLNLNPLNWLSVLPPTKQQLDGDFEISVVHTNWYWRRLRRQFVFGCLEFYRVHPETRQTRATHSYRSVSEITVVDDFNLIIKYSDNSYPDYIQCSSADLQRVVNKMCRQCGSELKIIWPIEGGEKTNTEYKLAKIMAPVLQDPRKTSEFKKSDLEARKIACDKIRDGYPDRIPIIVEKAPCGQCSPRRSFIKLLFPNDGKVSALVRTVKCHLESNLTSDDAIILFVVDILPQTALISKIYDRFKDEDGFLYVMYHIVSFRALQA